MGYVIVHCVVSYYEILSYILESDDISCHFMIRNLMSYHVMIYHVMICHVMIWHAMLYCVIFHLVIL